MCSSKGFQFWVGGVIVPVVVASGVIGLIFDYYFNSKPCTDRTPIEVLSVAHTASNTQGKYFNFNSSIVDTIIDSKAWDGDSFDIKNTRTNVIKAATLWRSAAYAGNLSLATGHGVWQVHEELDEENKWRVGDKFVIMKCYNFGSDN